MEERFWEKVRRQDDEGCWLWTAGTDRGGYGILGIGEKSHHRNKGAHRISWELAHGPVPDGLYVLHTCDTPPCVNPAHLFLGTKADNNRDRAAKGRNAPASANYRRGEHHGMAKLTDQQALEIRQRAEREPYKQVAADYGVTPELVGLIYRRQSWKHLP